MLEPQVAKQTGRGRSASDSATTERGCWLESSMSPSDSYWVRSDQYPVCDPVYSLQGTVPYQPRTTQMPATCHTRLLAPDRVDAACNGGTWPSMPYALVSYFGRPIARAVSVPALHIGSRTHATCHYAGMSPSRPARFHTYRGSARTTHVVQSEQGTALSNPRTSDQTSRLVVPAWLARVT